MNLEISRRELAVMPNFCIREFFKGIDSKNRGSLSLTDFKNLMNYLEIGNTYVRHFSTLFKLYDTDNDSYLNFKNFVQMVSPRDEKFFKLMTENKRISSKSKVIIDLNKVIFFSQK